ncbi:MAG: dihydrodipicolinate synthase family protein [Spirochaetales bacterium]
MNDLEKFKGIFPAFYACYDAEGNVSAERTKKLVNYFYDKGARGLYITGSSGESIYQTADERKIIIESVMEVAKEKMVIIAHVGAPSTRDSVELAKWAKTCGVDAIASIPPIYFPFSEKSVQQYWKRMIDAADMPFIIYNIPHLTGFNMSKKFLQTMLEDSRVIGVKNTSLPVMDIQQFKDCGGKNCIIYNGPDEQLAAGLLMGADGGIGGTYGIMPELFIEIYNSVQKKDFEKAKNIQYDVTNLIMELLEMDGHMLAVVKEILKIRGLDIGIAREPLPPITTTDIPKIDALEKKVTATIAKYC